MIQGIIFDFDNTLYNYELCNGNALNIVFNFIKETFFIELQIIKNKYTFINKNIKESNNYCNKFNKDIYFKKLLEELNIPIFNLYKIINLYNEEFNNNLTLFDNVIDLLKILKKNNLKIGILSNNIFKQQYEKLIKLNILDFIDVIQTSDEVGYEKPNKLIFLYILNKMNLNPNNVIMIGDNYGHDIIPSLELKLIPFHFLNNFFDFHILKNYFEFGNYKNLILFFNNYFKSETELIHLSKLFGQSDINIQGQGGNISVKCDELILIKSSGEILGNINYNDGFCVANNNICKELLVNNNSKDLASSKIFGNKIPSMETFFHSFMKKYTIHIHFTLSNIFLCSGKNNILNDLNIKNVTIDYYKPGIELAKKIYEVYDINCNLYFLKNHGLIISSDTIDEVNELYKKVFYYFNELLNNQYINEIISFDISIYINKFFNKQIICKNFVTEKIDFIKNIKYCFPDLAVYIQTIYIIENIEDIKKLDKIPDIIIYNEQIFIIAENLIKYYCIFETLDKYLKLCIFYKELEIVDEKKIQNMEQEKYRKQIF